MSADEDKKGSEKPEKAKPIESPPVRLTTDPMKFNKDHKDKDKDKEA